MESTYWNEQREYFKEKTLAFKELKKKREIEIMKKELERSKISIDSEKKLEIRNKQKIMEYWVRIGNYIKNKDKIDMFDFLYKQCKQHH